MDQALDLILAPNGLAATNVGNVIEVGLPASLGTRRHFEGDPSDFDFKDASLVECLELIAGRGGMALAPDPSIQGRVTVTLQRVPWDQAFDVIARLNGLAWKAEGRTIRVGSPSQVR